MTLAAPGATGFVALAQRAVIGMSEKNCAAITAPDVQDHDYGSCWIAAIVASSNASPAPA